MGYSLKNWLPLLKFEVADKYEIEDAVTAVTDCARLFIPLDQLVDKEKEIARLEKEKAKSTEGYRFLKW